MSLFRRGVLFLVSCVLLIGLIGVAFAISTNQVLGKSANVKTAFKQSGLYGSFADTLIDQAATDGSIGADKLSLTNPVVKQAAQDALSQQYLEKQGSDFIDGNYAWLEGKEAKPDFRIDLTPAREDFAKRITTAAISRINGLPACSAAQLAQLQSATSTDLLTIACKPSNLNLDTEATRFTKEILDSSSFLNNALITPESLNPTDSNQNGEPYYKKLSFAPQLYTLQQFAPFIFGAIILLCIIFMYVLANPRRKATRRLASTLLVAGLLLLVNKFGADYLFDQLEKQAVNSQNNGKLQESLVNLSHHIESQLVRIDMYFGIGFVVSALLLYLVLRATKGKTADAKGSARAYKQAVKDFTAEPATPSRQSAPRPVTNQPAQSGSRPTSAPQLQPRRKRPPRLIQ